MSLTLRELDALSPGSAAAELRACCGSSAWITGMLARRPFRTRDALQRAAHEVWAALTSTDWHEAIDHHPRLGERKAALAAGPSAASWSSAEQSGVRSATPLIKAALAEGNRAYEARFGFIFIYCAAGKSADDMLTALEQRLNNDATTETRIAARELEQIMQLRLDKLVTAE